MINIWAKVVVGLNYPSLSTLVPKRLNGWYEDKCYTCVISDKVMCEITHRGRLKIAATPSAIHTGAIHLVPEWCPGHKEWYDQLVFTVKFDVI